MKYLIIPLVLLIAGCTRSNQDIAYSDLKETAYLLSSCQAELKELKSQTTTDTASAFNQAVEEAEQRAAEPICEDVSYYVAYQDGKPLATCKEAKEAMCGISLEECTNGYTYNCLTNVKFGSETKKVCE